MEKYKKQFSHSMRLSDREEAAVWISAVRKYNEPKDDHLLHGVGINIFTAIGRLSDGVYRDSLFGRLAVLERQRARNKLKEQCAIQIDGV